MHDIDLPGTSLTDILRIRRGTWVTEEPPRLRMARVPLDSLDPAADGQVCTRLTKRRFRYQAENGRSDRLVEREGEGP